MSLFFPVLVFDQDVSPTDRPSPTRTPAACRGSSRPWPPPPVTSVTFCHTAASQPSSVHNWILSPAPGRLSPWQAPEEVSAPAGALPRSGCGAILAGARLSLCGSAEVPVSALTPHAGGAWGALSLEPPTLGLRSCSQGRWARLGLHALPGVGLSPSAPPPAHTVSLIHKRLLLKPTPHSLPLLSRGRGSGAPCSAWVNTPGPGPRVRTAPTPLQGLQAAPAPTPCHGPLRPRGSPGPVSRVRDESRPAASARTPSRWGVRLCALPLQGLPVQIRRPLSACGFSPC